jgi:hypothetical protein
MGFVQRAFTPPGTGGAQAAAEAAPQIAAQQQLAANVEKQRIANLSGGGPSVPSAGAPPAAPQQFMPGQGPGAKQAAQITASSMLGAAATAGQTSKKSVLGG